MSSTAERGWTGCALPRRRWTCAWTAPQSPATRVELNGETYRCDARATADGQVTPAAPGRAAPGAWLYLSRDRKWLDYRAIGEYTGAADLARAGVDVEVPEDPESEIQALLSQGEGLQVEFKRQLPGDSAESKRTVFKTVAAFANGHGGSIVFGVESDEATVCGLNGIDPVAERTGWPSSPGRSSPRHRKWRPARMNTTARRCWCSPSAAEPDPPYGTTLPGKQGKPVEFYVRRDATTFPARADELRNAVLAAAPWQGSRQYFADVRHLEVPDIQRSPITSDA